MTYTVSWILRSITDPEALDAAIRLTGEIRWFDDGLDVNPPYDLIVSTFDACFGSGWRLHPGSRDRTYYSGRAILWVHTLAMSKSMEFANTIVPPRAVNPTSRYDPDLENILGLPDNSCFGHLFNIFPGCTPSHSAQTGTRGRIFGVVVARRFHLQSSDHGIPHQRPGRGLGTFNAIAIPPTTRCHPKARVVDGAAEPKTRTVEEPLHPRTRQRHIRVV